MEKCLWIPVSTLRKVYAIVHLREPKLRSHGVSHQQYTVHGLRGGGATDRWLPHRDVQLRRRARWTTERTLERYIHEGTVPLHQSQLSKEVADRRSALAELAPRFFAEQDTDEAHHQPPLSPRCIGKGGGVHSVLRSGVEQRSFAHTVLPLGALLLPLSDVGHKEQADDAHHTSTDTLG